MSDGVPAEGCIDIVLSTNGERITRADIDNRRPLGIVSYLTGLAPFDAVQRVARLFSVCRFAQGVAAAIAVEQALGLDPAPPQTAARHILVLAETVSEHANRAVLDWAPLAGEVRPVAQLKRLRACLADLWRDLYPDGDWMRPGGGRLVPDLAGLSSRLDAAMEGLKQAGLFMPLEVKPWRNWIDGGTGPAAALLRQLERDEWAGCGASDVGLLDLAEPDELAHLLAADSDGTLVRMPERAGQPRETGALARWAGDPVIADVIARHGRGLAARYAAQCLDTARSILELRDFLFGLCDDEGVNGAGGDGHGLGVVETARGVLAHRVEIMEGRVSRYQILAPTEWNFHPRGALARGLVEGSQGRSAERLAWLMVTAFDPCVPWRLEMR